MKNKLLIAIFLSAISMNVHSEIIANQNKELVVNFYNEVLFQGKYKSIDKYIGDKYIQHNPHVPDGKEALAKLIKGFVPSSGEVEPFGEIIRVIAENDLVVLHIKNFNWPTKNGSAVIDIFRVEKGKIVEHWDVVQEIPEKSANNNTMF